MSTKEIKEIIYIQLSFCTIFFYAIFRKIFVIPRVYVRTLILISNNELMGKKRVIP